MRGRGEIPQGKVSVVRSIALFRKQRNLVSAGQVSRRGFLRRALTASLIAVVWPLPACRRQSAQRGKARLIKMGGKKGELVFNPDRLRIEPGETVRWVVEATGHSTTAYHPQNHPLYRSRIPEGAQAWDSGVLFNKGDSFEHTFTVEGVYHYYCIPHEGAGMVGAILVGRLVDGPATSPVQPEINPAARSKLEELMAWAKTIKTQG